MTRLTVGFIVLCIIGALAIVWTMRAIHSICEAIKAILDIMHSRDRIENLACQRIVELQADKGRLTDENKKLQEELKIQKHNTHTVAYLGDCIEDIQDKKIAEQNEKFTKVESLIRELLSICKVEMSPFAREAHKDIFEEIEAFLREVDHETKA